MAIGMLLNAPYPSDVRIKKETDALLAAGFTVHLLCLKRPGEKADETVNGLHIHRIQAGESNHQLAFWDVIMSVTFIHPVFKRALMGLVKKYSIDALHVHDLPLAGTALNIRRQFHVPVIVDYHENYPDALRTWFTWKKNPIAQLKNKIFMNPDRWLTLEKKATRECDHVIAVVDEMKRRILTDYDVPDAKVTVVSNTEDKLFLQQPEDTTLYKDYSNKFIITYTGNIGPHRGVDTVIEAMQYLKEFPEIVFIVVGSGSQAVMSMLKNLCIRYGVTNQVFFLGRQPFEKFYSYMKFADLNIIPHKSNRHTDNTVPHKLFQAMMTGKPVMVSSSAPLKRIVTATNSGIVFEAGDAKDLAANIKANYKNTNLLKQWGENGLTATVHGTLNWEHEQVKLVNLYQSLAKAK